MAHFNLENYETVQERLDVFWAKFPEGRVETTLLPSEAGRYIVHASIFRDVEDLHPFSTGLAEEVIGAGMVNKTSALENCETSAIGRALRNGGIGKQASREEMEKVKRHTSAPTTITEAEVQTIVAAAEKAQTVEALREIWASLPADALTFILGDNTTLADYLKLVAANLQTDTQKG